MVLLPCLHAITRGAPEGVPSKKLQMSIRTSLAWAFSQQFAQYGFTLLGSIVIARLLTPAEMGVFALAMAAGFLIGALRDFGVGTYLVREKDLNDLKIRTAFGMWLTVSWTIGLILLLIRHHFAEIYNAPGIADVLVVIALNYFIGPIGMPADVLMRREMMFRQQHHITLACSTASLAVTLTLAFMGFSFMALAWGFVTNTSVRTIILFFLRPQHVRMLPSFRYWRDVLRFGGLVTLASFMITLNMEGIKFVLGWFINPAGAALYERGNQIPVMLRDAVNGPLGTVLLPAFARSAREGQSIGTAVEKLISGMTAIIWPAYLTIGLLAQPIILFVFGKNWVVAGDLLPYLLLTFALCSALPDPSQILVPRGRVKTLFWLVLFATTNNLTLSSIGASQSLMMFAMLQPVHAAIYAIAIYFVIRPHWQADTGVIFVNYAKAIAIAVLSAIPAATAIGIYGWAVPPIALFCVAGAAPFFWLASIFLLRHPLSNEIGSLLSVLRPKLRPKLPEATN